MLQNKDAQTFHKCRSK